MHVCSFAGPLAEYVDRYLCADAGCNGELAGAAGQKTGQLDAKTRELIAVAVAISLRCDGCITVHTDAARKLGATEAELAEALGVATSINAGAAVVYATRALDAFAASAEA